MISPVCDRCGKELQELGGILFSPLTGKTVTKLHICRPCYSELIKGFDTK